MDPLMVAAGIVLVIVLVIFTVLSIAGLFGANSTRW